MRMAESITKYIMKEKLSNASQGNVNFCKQTLKSDFYHSFFKGFNATLFKRSAILCDSVTREQSSANSEISKNAYRTGNDC